MRTSFHDPLIIPLKDEYLGLSTDLQIAGVQARTSKDLLTWSEPFPLLCQTPETVKRHVNTDRFWAPELIRRGSKWQLYCCASCFGLTHSVIGLAESEDPKGPFTYVGDVIQTQHSQTITRPNAIDPCVIADRDGKDWLVYGSFYGGIRILPLGEDGFPCAYNEGKCIAGGEHRPVEGAYIIYHKESDRFILFTSWGSIHSDYHIRVGYSKEVDGPYLDSNGVAMTELNPCAIPGDKISGGYNFDLPGLPGVMATGHNSVMQKENELYIVSHARPEGDREHAFLQIRRLLFSKDQRLMVWPLEYDGTSLEEAPELPDHWRMIYLARSNWGLIYGRPVTLSQEKVQRSGDQIHMELFNKEWDGYVYKQGAYIACVLLSPDGECLWGVAEDIAVSG